MAPQSPRSEPRFTLGARVLLQVNRRAGWHDLPALTVNVSESGLLVTVSEAPAIGESVRVKLPDRDDFKGEAVVRHVVRGNANYLVGLHFQRQRGSWLLPGRRAPAEDP